MKGRVGIIILVIICIGLGIGLLVRHKQAVHENVVAQDRIMNLSNNWVQAQAKVGELNSVNHTLETSLSGRTHELENVSNNFVAVSATLAKTQAEAKAAADAAAAEMAKRDAKISELQGQNDDMTKRMLELNTSLGSLEKQIAATEKKLATSEGDREFLLRELKRLQGEKAELEKQFNDLAVLREQVSKLKDELSLARRIEWIRRGIYGAASQKGAEGLTKLTQPAPAAGTNANLNVELKQSGGVKVQSSTNAPAVPNAPPK
jgi:chromosome segregation ATPase